MKPVIGAFAVIAALGLAAPSFAHGGGHGGSHGGSHSRSTASTGEHYVRAHTTKNGTFVQGHYQTNPNGTKNDNYSTIGNVNPHTGEPGTKPGDGQ